MKPVKFKKTYENEALPTIYYNGYINACSSKIIGTFGPNEEDREEPSEDAGRFVLEQQEDAPATIRFRYTDKDKEEFEVSCMLDYEKFMFFNDDEEEKVKISSLELCDNAVLVYQINSFQTQFSVFREQSVIISDFLAKEVVSNEHNARGYSEANQKAYFIEEENDNFKKEKPKKVLTIPYLLNAGVVRSQNKSDTQLLRPMNGAFTSNVMYIGATLYAQIGTNELIMNFGTC